MNPYTEELDIVRNQLIKSLTGASMRAIEVMAPVPALLALPMLSDRIWRVTFYPEQLCFVAHWEGDGEEAKTMRMMAFDLADLKWGAAYLATDLLSAR